MAYGRLAGAPGVSRRQALEKMGGKFLLGMVGMLAAIVAFQRFAGPADGHHRKLEGYSEGMCDGFIYTEYFYLMIALQCWAIYYVRAPHNARALAPAHRAALPPNCYSTNIPRSLAPSLPLSSSSS